jgi:putative ubiquitin-RnfH superfamily antitoxin RatB of RatAB toxin-antitoxin module
MESKLISVEVAYAEDVKQILIRLELPTGTTVLEAIEKSTVLIQFPHLASRDIKNKVGIFGKTVDLSTPLKTGDRVEIYRDLIRNPKENRRLKAQIEKRKKAQAFDEKKRQKKIARKFGVRD